jgi:hypothetical protein
LWKQAGAPYFKAETTNPATQFHSNLAPTTGNSLSPELNPQRLEIVVCRVHLPRVSSRLKLMPSRDKWIAGMILPLWAL